MMNSKTPFARAALVSAIALAFSMPTFAQSSGSPAGDSGGQTKAGATATTGTTSATPSAPAGATGTTMKSDSKVTTPSGEAKSGGAASGAASNDTTRGAPDNTNAKARSGTDMSTWVKHQASEHKGRISRQAYLDEMARRWDSLDRNNQGLTPAEVSRLTGKVDVDHSVLPRTGSDVQAGNMGPTSVKGK